MTEGTWHQKTADLLSSRIGLNPDSIGKGTLDHIIGLRTRKNDLPDVREYFNLISKSGDELNTLIYEVVVNKTWFFRHPGAFDYMGRRAISLLESRTPKTEKIRLLSVGCATGEEPYSMAMALMDRGLSPEQFKIEGIDISTPALGVARAGRYRRNSFHSPDDLSFRDRHFTMEGGEFSLKENIKSCVSFWHGNALSLDQHFHRNSYHFVFCRNLLIYMGARSQTSVVSGIAKLLKSDGALLVGCAEGNRHVLSRFDSAKSSGAFAYIVKANKPTAAGRVISSHKNTRPVRKSTASAWPTSIPQETLESIPPRSRPAPDEPRAAPIGSMASVESARELADRGSLAEALKMCCECIEVNSQDTEAHTLEGIVAQATGDTARAEASFRRSLYLDPNSVEALVHLSLLAEESGDQREALLLKERVLRIRQRLEEMAERS